MYSKAFRFIAFVSLPLLSITSFAQKKETKIILWKKDCPLTWTDFRPVEKKESNEVALTSCTIDSKFDQINKDTIEATIPCLFNKHESWTIQKYQSSDLLNHEQHHFDIGEIAARKLRKKLEGKKFFSKEKCIKYFNKVATKIYKEFGQEEVLYDKETDHHNNKEQQKIWNVKIENELKALDAYSDIHVYVRLKHFLFF